ncbi:MAG: DUF3891 family protein [Verrucomicrobia bacterium]|nr:DUF3891 family protein [Verrucomicrobiota bacterium]
MIIQRSSNDQSAIAISQVAHSWMSGQMAREWGNAEFGTFEPREPLCYAAEQHDIGFFSWERRPRWNPGTGFPFTFEDLPISEHIEIWQQGIDQLGTVSAYAALMASFHFAGLCERHSRKGVEAGSRTAEAFLRDQRRHREELLAFIARDWTARAGCTEEAISNNRKLIATWDLLSLQLSRNPSKAFDIEGVPWTGGSGGCTLSISPSAFSGRVFHVNPWPFSSSPLRLCCEGYLFERPFRSQEELDQAFTARSVSRLPIEYILLPRT